MVGGPPLQPVPDRLAAIVASVRRRLAERQARRPETELEEAAATALRQRPRRSLRQALAGGRQRPAPPIIAEVKRASPAAGRLAAGGPGAFDPVAQARRYAAGGAVAISVVTEPDHFGGDPQDVLRVGSAELPVLRKDFILTRYQLLESVVLGADAVLLIARILEPRQLARLVRWAEEWSLEPLVEVNDRRDVEVALAAGATLVGINNRDLRTFAIDRERTAKLLPLLPPSVTVVAASGIQRPEQARRLHALGVDACLVGEALMRSPDPVRWLQQVQGPDPETSPGLSPQVPGGPEGEFHAAAGPP